MRIFDRSLAIITIIFWSRFAFGLAVNNFFLGGMTYKYEEPSIMNISGLTYEVGYIHRNSLINNFSYRLELELAYGDGEYDGAVVSASGTTPIKAPSQDLIGDGRFFVEYYIPAKVGLLLCVGIANRYLVNRIDHFAAYLREQTYIYLPLALYLETSVASKYRIYVAGEYDSLLEGTNVSHINGPLTFKQKTGYGYRFLAGFAFDTKKFPLNIEIIYRYWSIADSTFFETTVGSTLYTFHEPINDTNTLGLRVGFSF